MPEQTQQTSDDAALGDTPAGAAANSGVDANTAEPSVAGRDVDNHKAVGADGARRATLPDLNKESIAVEDDANLRMILDIPVTVSMEIGRTRLPIRTLLQLNQGSVVELERLVGEPLDVLVNGTLIAHGEVVVINEKYGIRLTDVVSPDERVRKLR